LRTAEKDENQKKIIVPIGPNPRRVPKSIVEKIVSRNQTQLRDV